MRFRSLTILICMLLILPVMAFGQQNGVTGQPVPPTSVQVAGSDGTNLRTLKTDTTGQLVVAAGTGASANQVQGTAATGASPVGNPVYIGGLDITNFARPIAVDSQGGVAVARVAITAADATSNTLSMPMASQGQGMSYQNFNMVFNGSTWDRMRGSTSGIAISNGGNVLGDGVSNSISVLNTAGGSTLYSPGQIFVFNGTSWDRQRTAALANYATSVTTTARNSIGAQIAEKGSRFSVVSAPAVSNQATASIAAEASVRHTCDCVSFSGGSTTAPALTALTVNLRDGATGAGTVIWTQTVIVSASTGQNIAPFSVCGLNLVGTTNTAMTLEFSALLTNLFESVTLTGFNVN